MVGRTLGASAGCHHLARSLLRYFRISLIIGFLCCACAWASRGSPGGVEARLGWSVDAWGLRFFDKCFYDAVIAVWEGVAAFIAVK